MSRDEEIARVAADLDALLGPLKENVDALTALLAPSDDGKEPAR